MFPSIGHGFGPGGRGNFGGRANALRTRNKANAAVATPNRRFGRTVVVVSILVNIEQGGKEPEAFTLSQRRRTAKTAGDI